MPPRPPGPVPPTTPPPCPRSPGLSASTASASRSMTATQPGPLSAHWASTMSSRAIPSIRATRSTSASSTGPDRTNGGAANASRSPPRGSAPAPPRTPARRPRVLRRSAHLEPRVARPQRRVAGERQLDRRREDAHPVVGLGGGRREHERRLGQVRPVRDLLHVAVREPARVEYDRHGVPAVRLGREHVDLGERALHRPKSARRHAFTRSLQPAGTFQVASRTWVGVGHSGWV